MTLQETMRELESMGTAQNRKVYARHGYPANTFGVSFANLGKLAKKIKRNHALASELWTTGNGDAMCLATMVADPSAMTAKDLDAWVQRHEFYMLAGLLARNVVAKTPHLKRCAERWSRSKHDFVGEAGYVCLALLAMQDAALPDAYFEEWLKKIEHGIHKAQNRTRYGMNNALIAIGLRGGLLEKLSLAAAKRIGKVEVDHGETGCKTPDAGTYIRKTAARKKAS